MRGADAVWVPFSGIYFVGEYDGGYGRTYHNNIILPTYITNSVPAAIYQNPENYIGLPSGINTYFYAGGEYKGRINTFITVNGTTVTLTIGGDEPHTNQMGCDSVSGQLYLVTGGIISA